MSDYESDATLRTIAEQTSVDKLGAAVTFDTGPGRADFENYIAALRATSADKEAAFSAAMVSGRSALGAWPWLPAAWAPVMALLDPVRFRVAAARIPLIAGRARAVIVKRDCRDAVTVH